jgi:ABC-type oligopeptide transport system substrate-binding subunit
MNRKSLVMTAIGCAALASVSAVGATAGEHGTKPRPAATTATPADPAAARCNGLRNSVAQHIETMKTLNAQIKKERQTPSDLEGMVETWSGYHGTAALKELTAKLAKERRTTEEIAALLPAYKCPPVDIDAELKRPPAPQKPASTSASKNHRKVF